ncbi:MAG: dihydropteroate synthase [Deltaproteobacteria bacterium]
MADAAHIPLGVGFYPDWFYENYGISFGEAYYFDPETRVETRMEIDRRLYERFGDVGLGAPDPKPKPLITFGMVMLPAVFGCEIVYKDAALPWAMPLNLSEDEVMALEVPDIFNTYPMTEMIRQINYLKEKYGTVVGDINTTGVQNLALKIRGDQLYFDFFENPDLCHHLLDICTQCVIQLFQFNHETTGTGAVDVTPMCDPTLYVIPNCTAEQISNATYEKFILPYDNRVADACHPLGIHHCGSINEVLPGYAKVHHLKFVEIGFGSDVKRAREVFGPDVAINARINPVLMKNGTADEVAAEVRRLIDQGDPLYKFSIDTVGLTHGTPDENVRAARMTAAEYGKIDGGRKPVRAKAVQAEALRQVEAGAQVLDVNVGVSGIDEPKMLKAAVAAVQAVTDVPLCIDSAVPEALAAALSVYEGKALVNSVNGEAAKLDRVLPLVKEHGAAVIGLTMDDEGIPAGAEKRVEIAETIIGRALEIGIPREDVIIDPLAMAISAESRAGVETLRALQMIRDALGVNQTLGLSNISFGLPGRHQVNGAFLAMAVQNWLTCPILDPTVWEMRLAVLISDMLLGRDEFCMNYIRAASKGTEGDAGRGSAPEPAETGEGGYEALKEAVISGRRKKAVDLTRKALAAGMDPQDIINTYLIPGLNMVGERFERKEIFVPEMMISAKTMQACVDELTPVLKQQSGRSLGTVVIGTVFGDLHDIGKNLTRLLLETSGFKVVDLGENVPAETFLEQAKAAHADVVGLSSLLTTGDPHVEETVKALKESEIGDQIKIICGGAAMTPRFVLEVCGADAHAENAADGVSKIKAFLSL